MGAGQIQKMCLPSFAAAGNGFFQAKQLRCSGAVFVWTLERMPAGRFLLFQTALSKKLPQQAASPAFPSLPTQRQQAASPASPAPQQTTAGSFPGFSRAPNQRQQAAFPDIPPAFQRKAAENFSGFFILFLKIFGVKGTFYKKSPYGVQGADPDRAQWAKKGGGGPLSKEAPEALANRGDHCEVRQRPWRSPFVSPPLSVTIL